MADDSPDEAHDDVDHEREPVQIRCSMSREWVETELLPAYPAVTSASQAARNACMDGVEAQQGQGGLRAEIRGEIVDVLRESGVSDGPSWG